MTIYGLRWISCAANQGIRVVHVYYVAGIFLAMELHMPYFPSSPSTRTPITRYAPSSTAEVCNKAYRTTALPYQLPTLSTYRHILSISPQSTWPTMAHHGYQSQLSLSLSLNNHTSTTALKASNEPSSLFSACRPTPHNGLFCRARVPQRPCHHLHNADHW